MQVKIHSSQKHRLLGYYFSVIKDLIKSKKTPFKMLYYADLYSGDGECVCEQTGRTWPSALFSLLGYASSGDIQLKCFLNDLDAARIDKLKDKTKGYSQFIVDYATRDANSYYSYVLSKIPPDQLSIFFLDPTNHQDLKWTTIAGISKHVNQYWSKKKGCFVSRRPELVINLMVYTMLGSYKAKSYQSIDEAIGTHAWFDKVEENKKSKYTQKPVESALLDTFTDQLKGLGYYVPKPIGITTSYPGNVVYYMIWATNETGYDVIEHRIIPYIEKDMEGWKKEITREQAEAYAKRLGVEKLEKWM